jgi:predicted transcriptional regulator
MITSILRRVGLSEGEVRIYVALIDLGSVKLSIIQEKTGIERRNIYDILNKLIEKGLVSYTEENKKKSFQVTDPKKLISYLEEKKAHLQGIQEEVAKQLPILLEKFKSNKPTIRAEVFRGIEGIKAVWEDILNYPEMRWIGSGRYLPKKYPNFFIPWNKRRIENKVWWFNLMRQEIRSEIKHPLSLEKIRYLPEEFSGNPAVIGIYGNKVAQFLFGEYLFAFVIESKELADNYKRYHRYLWDKVAKP